MLFARLDHDCCRSSPAVAAVAPRSSKYARHHQGSDAHLKGPAVTLRATYRSCDDATRLLRHAARFLDGLLGTTGLCLIGRVKKKDLSVQLSCNFQFRPRGEQRLADGLEHDRRRQHELLQL